MEDVRKSVGNEVLTSASTDLDDPHSTLFASLQTDGLSEGLLADGDVLTCGLLKAYY